MSREIDTDVLAEAHYASVDPQFRNEDRPMSYQDYFYEARLKSMKHLEQARDLIEDAADEIGRAERLEPDQRIKKALRKTCRHIDDLFAELEDLL